VVLFVVGRHGRHHQRAGDNREADLRLLLLHDLAAGRRTDAAILQFLVQVADEAAVGGRFLALQRLADFIVAGRLGIGVEVRPGDCAARESGGNGEQGGGAGVQGRGHFIV